jgi:hypothetical protein
VNLKNFRDVLLRVDGMTPSPHRVLSRMFAGRNSAIEEPT